MDVQNISNLESPLYNTLVTRSQRDPWTYSLLSNIGSFSKSRVEVPPQTDPGSFINGDQEVHWKIPRYGLLAKVCVLNRVEFTDAGYTADGAANYNDAFGFFLWKELRLETHNKRIQALYPEYQYMRMQSLPYERRQSMQGAVAQNGDALSTESADKTTQQFYTPCFFSFSERTNNFIDTRFVENLEVVGLARNGSQISTLGSGDEMKFSSGYPKLVCYFYNPTEEIYRAYQHRNFTLERPLTMLQYDVFRETPEVKAATGLTTDTVNGKTLAIKMALTKKLDCNNLVFATHLMVREKITAVAGGLTKKDVTLAPTDVTIDSTDEWKIKWGAAGNPGFVKGDKVTLSVTSGVAATFYHYQLGQTSLIDEGSYATLGNVGNGSTTEGTLFFLESAFDSYCTLVPANQWENGTPASTKVRVDRAFVKMEASTGIYTLTSTASPGAAVRVSAQTAAATSKDHKDFLQIENVKVSGTSRELVDQPGFELLHLDNSAYGRLASSASVSQFAGLTDASAECIYSLYWGLDNSRVACSGALSLKNLAAPEIEVIVDVGTADSTEYELLVFHEYWQLVSIQGSDGRVSVGISV